MEIQPVAFRLKDNVPTDTTGSAVFIPRFIFLSAEKVKVTGMKWTWQIIWSDVFLIVGIAPWKHIRWCQMKAHVVVNLAVRIALWVSIGSLLRLEAESSSDTL